jgi:hypothetical protein
MATGTIDGLEPLISRYIEVGQEHGHNLSLSNVAVISFTVVGDTDEKAEARAMAGLKNHFEKATATYHSRHGNDAWGPRGDRCQS